MKHTYTFEPTFFLITLFLVAFAVNAEENNENADIRILA